MTVYFRPLAQRGSSRPDSAVDLAGGATWFTQIEVLERGLQPGILTPDAIANPVLETLSATRAPLAGLEMSTPQVMGIVNVTPDSFSDGGVHFERDHAVASALSMADAGASIIDIGGESTRPGAEVVSAQAEIDRTAPVIEAIRAQSDIPISIDTRKAAVARAAVTAGATLINDVSGFTYDSELAVFCAEKSLPVCVMHAQGDPATMQDDPRYDDVLLDVYDFLAERVAFLETAGIPKSRIAVDPGIGFGKTIEHNLALLKGIGLFHSLGCAILLGASRKRFIGCIADEPVANRRVAGSIAVGLAALGQGVQILRVHDVEETIQALRLWQAVG